MYMQISILYGTLYSHSINVLSTPFLAIWQTSNRYTADAGYNTCGFFDTIEKRDIYSHFFCHCHLFWHIIIYRTYSKANISESNFPSYI